LVWAANFLYGNSDRSRIYGPELFLRLCKRCETEKIKIILYGNHTDLVCQKIKNKYPKIDIVVLPDLQYRKVSEVDVKYLLKQINKEKKSIIFIGIGSPAQHYLLAKLDKVKMPIVAVGAAFSFVSGIQKQAPYWMQKSGIAWLFRFACEPKRLWKRYLIYAPLFIILVFLQKIGFVSAEYAKNN